MHISPGLLYTLFDHDHLLGNIKWLLDTLSKNSGKICIKVDYFGAKWVTDSNDSDSYTVTEVMDMVSFLVRNSYIKAFGHVFQQVNGIIMGGKISGWLSDCSLMVDEFRYVRNLLSAGNREDAIKLRFFRRYRDDCTTLNCSDFLNRAQHIYPPSLSLTQENNDFDKANVLDMEVSIVNSCCVTKVYCKTDHFPFEVISLPFLESNIDSGLCYRVFYGQVIRFQRLCSNRSDFESRVKFLGDILVSRGFQLSRLCHLFCRAVDQYIQEFQKWSIPSNLKSWFHSCFTPTVASHAVPVSNGPLMSFSQPLQGPVTSNNPTGSLSQP